MDPSAKMTWAFFAVQNIATMAVRSVNFIGFLSNQCKCQKMGINYPVLEPGNEFWNRVRVPGFCYRSLLILVTCNTMIDARRYLLLL